MPDPASSGIGAAVDPREFGFDLDDESWMASLREHRAAPTGGRLGPYDLLDEIGRGGQGIVYKARQPGTGREVALKRMSAGAFATPEMRSRFDREIASASLLEHPHIVTVHGAEEIDGQLTLVMQWVDGVPFDRWASGAPRPSEVGSGNSCPRRAVRDVLGAFHLVCDAVQHAHQRGVIHRDLKPSNILVDSGDRPHVLDFGLAKLREDDSAGDAALTITGHFVGTPQYAAPEQLGADANDIDVRTDVHALGAVLYRALTGRTPFGDSRDLPRLLDDIQHRDARRPSSLDPRVDAELDAIVLKCLAKEKDHRYPSVDAFAADVRRYLAGDPVTAHPPSAVYRMRKFARRHAGMTTLSIVTLAALIALGVGSTVMAARERALRREAEDSRNQAQREAQVQKNTANALLGIIQRISQHAGGRPSVSVGRLAGWLAYPLNKSRLDLRPDAEFDLNMAVGGLLTTVGSHAEAAVHYQRARELASALYGPDSPQTRRAWQHSAGVLCSLKKFGEAEAAARAAMDIALRREGDDSVAAAEALEVRSCVQEARGDKAELEKSLRAVVALRDKVGPSADHRAAVRNKLAGLLMDTGRSAEARRVLHDALDILHQAASHNPNWDAHLWMQLGWNEFGVGQVAEAEKYFAMTVDYRIKRQGLEYARTNQALRSHGQALYALGRYAEAADRFEKALVWQERARSANAGDLASLRFHLAASLLAAGRTEEGRRHLLRAVSRGKVSLRGDAKWDTVADSVETSLRGNAWSIDATRRANLGKLSWLVAAIPGEPPGDGDRSTNEASATDDSSDGDHDKGAP